MSQVTNRFEKKNKEAKQEIKKVEEKNEDKLRYGPMPRFPHQRVWSRCAMLFGVFIYVWYFSKTTKETVLAARKDITDNRGQNFDCNEKYIEDIMQFPNCAPKTCGRYVTDKLVTEKEAKVLFQMAKYGLSYGGSTGGASILDVHSGALSYGEKFVNIYNLNTWNKFDPQFIETYDKVTEKVKNAVSELFHVSKSSLYLTHPTFFSKLTNTDPKTPHDEYWHLHIDKETYESFHYTSLLYLSDHGIDFEGGRFIFQDKTNGNEKNVTIEPRLGRVSMFTSGSENTHFVERVTKGYRYATTISFTCDPKHSIKLFSSEEAKDNS